MSRRHFGRLFEAGINNTTVLNLSVILVHIAPRVVNITQVLTNPQNYRRKSSFFYKSACNRI